MNISRLLGATMVAGAGPETGTRRLPQPPGATGGARKLAPTPRAAAAEIPHHSARHRRPVAPTRKVAR